MENQKSYLLSLNCGTKNIHNQGTMYIDGRLCADCGKFIKHGTLEYFMTEGITDIWMSIHNRSASFHRGESDKDIDPELKQLLAKVKDRDTLLKMTETEAHLFMEETYLILDKYLVDDQEATILMK